MKPSRNIPEPARRWCCEQGDCVLWVRARHSAKAPGGGLTPWDYWTCQTRDAVLVAERREQWPQWLAAHPDIDGPTVWRVGVGDWVAWVGHRPDPSGPPTVLDLYRCRTGSVIVREPAQLGMDIETCITTLMGGLEGASPEATRMSLQLGLRATIDRSRRNKVAR
jgi:hypothetical protein